MNNLQKILKQLGFSKVSRECGVTRQAVYQWFKSGRLPKTENLPHDNTRMTKYSVIIAYMAKVSVEELLKVEL